MHEACASPLRLSWPLRSSAAVANALLHCPSGRSCTPATMNWRSVFIFLAVAVLPAVRAGLAQCLAEGAGELAERDGSAWEDAVTLQNNWRDEGPAPAAVVLPSSTAEVSRAIKCANEHGVRVTARCGSHGQAGAPSTADSGCCWAPAAPPRCHRPVSPLPLALFHTPQPCRACRPCTTRAQAAAQTLSKPKPLAARSAHRRRAAAPVQVRVCCWAQSPST